MTHPLEVILRHTTVATTPRIDRKEALDFIPAQPLFSTPAALSQPTVQVQ